MSIEGETEYKAKVRLEARLGEHLNFSPGGLAQNCQHVAGFEPGSCGSETRILPGTDRTDTSLSSQSLKSPITIWERGSRRS